MCNVKILCTGFACLWVIAILIINHFDNKRMSHDID